MAGGCWREQVGLDESGPCGCGTGLTADCFTKEAVWLTKEAVELLLRTGLLDPPLLPCSVPCRVGEALVACSVGEACLPCRVGEAGIRDQLPLPLAGDVETCPWCDPPPPPPSFHVSRYVCLVFTYPGI